MKIFLVVHCDGTTTNYDAFKDRDGADESADETSVSYYSTGVELERSGDVWTGVDEGREIRISIHEVDLR